MTMFVLPNVAILAHRAAHAAWTVMGAVVVGLPDTLYTWQQRHRMRRELLGLDERLLRDMGISRYDATREGRRPFWQR
jgi:uncharacterized protein YjiS (DUF1127 family)